VLYSIPFAYFILHYIQISRPERLPGVAREAARIVSKVQGKTRQGVYRIPGKAVAQHGTAGRGNTGRKAKAAHDTAG